MALPFHCSPEPGEGNKIATSEFCPVEVLMLKDDFSVDATIAYWTAQHDRHKNKERQKGHAGSARRAAIITALRGRFSRLLATFTLLPSVLAMPSVANTFPTSFVDFSIRSMRRLSVSGLAGRAPL